MKSLKAGDVVNLERALLFSSNLGGHLVQGHIDSVGTVLGIERVGSAWNLKVEFSEKLAPFMIEKGSIAIDGI